ncbi:MULTISPECIES: hypothetical protein [Paracoccus]|uniref:hypothetical protein n=1 Tax=Paracoccus TaxID=265 RepID=UPI000DB90B57|nr:hypothetical protein [Paracoccus sediminilitoris]
MNHLCGLERVQPVQTTLPECPDVFRAHQSTNPACFGVYGRRLVLTIKHIAVQVGLRGALHG